MLLVLCTVAPLPPVATQHRWTHALPYQPSRPGRALEREPACRADRFTLL